MDCQSGHNDRARAGAGWCTLSCLAGDGVSGEEDLDPGINELAAGLVERDVDDFPIFGVSREGLYSRKLNLSG